MLHYCSNEPGFLLLGRQREHLRFRPAVFGRRQSQQDLRAFGNAEHACAPLPAAEVDVPTGRSRARWTPPAFPRTARCSPKHLDRLLFALTACRARCVKENMDVVLFRGQTGAYLQAAPGQPQNNPDRHGARWVDLGVARRRSRSRKRRWSWSAAAASRSIRTDRVKTCDVVVIPFSGFPDSKEPLFVVLFEEPAVAPRTARRAYEFADARAGDTGGAAANRPARARAGRDQGVPADPDRGARAAPSDELGTSNEELISGNEELQSMNEELETAKEELQSINEELTTLNDELQRRNQEVTQANSDLLNFSLTVDIPIVRLDMERRIRRFTPKARSILNVLAADVGRSIDDIKLNIEVPDLNEQITEVIETTTVKESEVQDHGGRWYRMQIRPYTTTNHVIDGAIFSLVDIHDLKQLVGIAQNARAEAERANNAKDEFLATLSHELRTPLSSMLLQRAAAASRRRARSRRTAAHGRGAGTLHLDADETDRRLARRLAHRRGQAHARLPAARSARAGAGGAR